MERINTEILLNTLGDKVEEHLRVSIDVFQNLDQSALLKPSATGGWSVAQCLEHLNRYGKFYLPAIRQGLECAPAWPRNDWFKSSWVGNKFTRMMDPATGKTKIKAFKRYQPQENLDAQAVVAEFIAQLETLQHLLRQAKNTDLNKIHIPISIARFIKLKLGDVFQFVIAHNERHVLQAKKNL